MRKLLLLSLILSASAQAEWQLADNSSLNFLTTKNTNLTEVHYFRTLSGKIEDNGVATLNIDLSSIDSSIPVRDQRMRDVLFETSRFTTATLTTVLTPELMGAIKEGRMLQSELKGKLALHGSEEEVETSVSVVAARDGSLQVSSIKPVLVHADAFSLTEGIQKLREIAGLERIANVVPVNFTLIFNREKN